MNTDKHIKFLTELNPSEIFVGFSGGADSTALLLLLLKCSQKIGFKVTAVHFQHNLRGADSLNDALWCRNFCEKYEIDYKEISLDVKGAQKSSEGTEAAARRLRNECWNKIVAEHTSNEKLKQSVYVALGHHADDRAENLILRLCRGSNVTGLSSMRAVQKIGDVTFIRPMLINSRTDIIRFLKTQNIFDWRSDISNSDESYKRNFIRHNILPGLYKSLDYSSRGIQHSLLALSEDADFIEEQANSCYLEISGKSEISINYLTQLHSALMVRIIRYWLCDQLGYEVLPNHRFISRLKSEVSGYKTSGEVKYIPFNGDVTLKVCRGLLSIHSNNENSVALPVRWNWREQPTIIWNGIKLTATLVDSLVNTNINSACFNSDTLPDILLVRSWVAGDSMVPYGRNHSVKLKKLFSNNKVIAENKASYPIICDSSDIIWIPNLRRSSHHLATSRSVVLITAERCNN